MRHASSSGGSTFSSGIGDGLEDDDDGDDDDEEGDDEEDDDEDDEGSLLFELNELLLGELLLLNIELDDGLEEEEGEDDEEEGELDELEGVGIA